MDPITMLAIALTLAGTGASYVGNRKAMDAQGAAMGAERKRQEDFDEDAAAINTKSRKRYGDVEGQMGDKASELAALFKADAPDTPAFGPAPSSSNITVQNEARERGEARDFTDKQGDARADLLSFGDVTGGINRERAMDATELAGIQGFRRGSEGVLGTELNAAQEQGSGFRLVGDLLKGAGSVATMGALSGADLPFGLGGTAAGTTPSLVGGPMHRPPVPQDKGLLSLFGLG